MNKKSTYLIGIDIGGTKTAVILGNSTPSIVKKISFPTYPSRGSAYALKKIEETVSKMIGEAGSDSISAIGISCGGPLDSEKGIILSPPNLPGWDAVPIVEMLQKKFKVPVSLQNDADACALAEWKWGAGKGCRNMIFITFGTGLGAGLILDGRLYTGTSDMAGEIGHVRLENSGPAGYGKAGSFEGFCSGGGIARLAGTVIRNRIARSDATPFCIEFAEKEVSAKDVCDAAEKGDSAAVQIFEMSGESLGKGLSILIDILNPERIIIGSIFTRCRKFLQPAAESVIEKEALTRSADVCGILPSALGEQIGDYGSLCAAENYLSSPRRGNL